MGVWAWLTAGRWNELPPMKCGESRPVSETEGGLLYRTLAARKCPDCGSKKGFYEGPSGGISTNIFCVNRLCRSGFNVTNMVGIADRIGVKGDLARYPNEE